MSVVAGRAASGSAALLERVIERARPLDPASPAAAASTAGDSADVAEADALLDHWCRVVASGDRERFARRLAWDGRDVESMRRELAGAGRDSSAADPRWERTFRRISRRAPAAPAPPSWASRIAFAEFFAPHLAVARERLREELASAGADLSALDRRARRDLELVLLRRLVHLSAECLLAAFDAVRGGPPLDIQVRLAEIDGGGPTGCYRAWLDGERASGLLAFHDRFPALARLTALAVDDWARNVAELLARFAADGEEIGRCRPGAAPHRGGIAAVPVVVAVRGGLSDPHHGGRSVLVVELEDGAAFVYKPRSLRLDDGFQQLLRWCNGLGPPLDLATHAIVDRGEYGWAQRLSKAACHDRAAIERFYVRAGMLLALLYAVGASDCHFENLVAEGEYLHLIDMETVLPPRVEKWLPDDGVDRARYEAEAELGRSVLATGMLPRWMATAGGDEVFNFGGIGGGGPRTERVREWVNVGSDMIARSWRPRRIAAAANLPTLGGLPVGPGDYGPSIRAGFEALYRLLLAHREELGQRLGEWFAGGETRTIFRPTRAYGVLLDSALRPPSQASGRAFSIALDAVCRVYLDAPARPSTWPIAGFERRALERGDVPLLRVGTETIDLMLPGGGRVPGFLAEPVVETVRRRLDTLSERDLRRQLALLRVGLSGLGPTDAAEPGIDNGATDDAEWSEASALEAVAEIARRLAEDAIRDDSGSASWLGLEPLADGEHSQLGALGRDLYSGSAGLALFLAAWAAFQRDESSRDLALGAIRGTRRWLRAASPERRRAFGLGGLTGLGSLIYALVRIGGLLGEPALVDEALAAATGIGESEIAAEPNLDVVTGCAGLALALLALDRALPDAAEGRSKVLELASACGRRLLAARRGALGERVWSAGHRPPLTGLSHGAAGIAYALLRLHQRLPDPALLAAAEEGIAFERRHYEAEQHNWRDLRFPARRGGAFAHTWCHGAPGIGLARIGGLPVLDDDAVRSEIEAGLATTATPGLRQVDHLCCGTVGRAEVLAHAGLRLAARSHLEAGRRLAGDVLARHSRHGSRFLLLPTRGGDFQTPSFFRGTAGIGYALLRLIDPARLPCVLLIE